MVLLVSLEYCCTLALSSDWALYFFSIWIEWTHPFLAGATRDLRQHCCAGPVPVDRTATTTTKSSNESSTRGRKSERKRGSRVERESGRQRDRERQRINRRKQKEGLCYTYWVPILLLYLLGEMSKESPSTTLPFIKVETLALYGRWEMKEWMFLKKEPSD